MKKNIRVVKFSERLRTVATSVGLSQSFVAKKIGKHRSEVGRWWNGDVLPNYETIEKIAAAIGCNPLYLETGEGDPWPEIKEPKSQKSSGDITASNGSTVIKAGKNVKNITGGKEVIELTETERKLILLNREVGNKKMLKLFIKKLEELDALTNNI